MIGCRNHVFLDYLGRLKAFFVNWSGPFIERGVERRDPVYFYVGAAVGVNSYK